MNAPEAKMKLVSWVEKLLVGFQMLWPTYLLSFLMFHITRIRHKGFKNALIRSFITAYRVDMRDAEFERPDNYPDFNAFFTRALKADARPADPNPRAFLSPVDGTVSQLGVIREGRIFQAKGIEYTAADLLGSEEAAAPFANGRFCTIYLAPYNYHRIHMPASGRLREWGYVPGRLFSVNGITTRTLPGLFVRNERVNGVFDTEFGPMALVMVGALFVGSIETAWAGRITPPHGHSAGRYIPMTQTPLLRGREVGRFNMGSTVIVLVGPKGPVWNPAVQPGQAVRMGSTLGVLVAGK